jgi:hypothetical protein
MTEKLNLEVILLIVFGLVIFNLIFSVGFLAPPFQINTPEELRNVIWVFTGFDILAICFCGFVC